MSESQETSVIKPYDTTTLFHERFLTQFEEKSWNEAFQFCEDLLFEFNYNAAVRLLRYYSQKKSLVMPCRNAFLQSFDYGNVRIQETSSFDEKRITRQAYLNAQFVYNISKNNIVVAKGCRHFDPLAAKGYLFRVFMCHPFLEAIASEVDESQSLIVAMNFDDQGGANCVSMCSNFNSSILIPDYDYLGSDGYEPQKREIVREWVPWNSRVDKVFWRGVASGYYQPSYPTGTSEQVYFTRGAIARQLKSDVANFDVGISSFDSLRGIAPPELVIEYERELLVDPCSLNDFLKHKYCLDIDGWGSAFSGLYTKLLMGTVVIKIDSSRGYKQWYYDRLKPFVHYIPCTADRDDIRSILDWCRANPGKAESIAAAGRDIALSWDYGAEMKMAISAISKSAF